MNKQELEKEAKKVAKELGVDVVYATTDGQFFKGESYAKLNAKNKKIECYTFNFKEQVVAEKPVTKPATATELIEAIKVAESETSVNEIVGTDKRKTVLEAAESRIKELTETKPAE